MSETSTRFFIYQFDPVRPALVTDPDAWTEDDVRVGKAHFDYLKRATAAGTVVLAGRSLDGAGPAIVIVEAPSEAAARAFMERDPFVAEGLMRASLHPFRLALQRDANQEVPA